MEEKFIKIRIVLDGWHSLSKRQTKDILKRARDIFRNANFFENAGLLVETDNELEAHEFCLLAIKVYKSTLGSWDGYEIKRLSRRILYNLADRKRKLGIDYFRKLIRESKLSDVKTVLAGTLYLEPDEVKNLLSNIEKDFDCTLDVMNDDELSDVYRILLMYSSSKERRFSLNK